MANGAALSTEVAPDYFSIYSGYIENSRMEHGWNGNLPVARMQRSGIRDLSLAFVARMERSAIRVLDLSSVARMQRSEIRDHISQHFTPI